MTPEAIAALRQDLPFAEPFHYYRDRESAWLLQARMPGDMHVRDVRQGPLAKLLDRPLIKPLTAAGGGMLRRNDLRMLARADCAFDYDGLTAAGYGALETVFDTAWMDFEITYEGWGDSDWRWAQMSRPGVNLVLQLGFPSDHGALLERTVGAKERSKFESSLHPVRYDGRPTLAWSRLDIDTATGTALIEEVQCDWLRYVRAVLRHLKQQQPRSRQMRVTQEYEMALTAQYDKVWSRALLLAVLILLRDRLGIETIFMHQPIPGALMKWIVNDPPPVSLYSALPKAFCFEPTRDVPPFLRVKRRKHLRKLARNKPLFWKMAF